MKDPNPEWLSIDINNMMREDVNNFYKFLRQFYVDYISYGSQGGNRIYLRLQLPNYILADPNHEFHKGMGEWVYYHPITMLYKKPKVSDHDILEDMSIDPYDTKKWRNN